MPRYKTHPERPMKASSEGQSLKTATVTPVLSEHTWDPG